ncbi:DUF4276 family protein [Paraburkholderia sediminicola]|uniref:DUF4276 family protein n=1 Tax=Paraburkholderia sediminicola TaxID=458836 RepID=UPI0038BAD729
MSKKIGVIAEDKSDIESVIAFMEKYIPKNKFTVKFFVGKGCGKLKQKCGSWAETLVKGGCNHIFVFHDLDRNDENKLRSSLLKKVPSSTFPNSLIVIPKEELEAWLLSDANALKEVFSLPKIPQVIADCETVTSPKERIRDIAWSLGKKRYLNTVHNKKLSEKVSLTNLRRCKSYGPFDAYVSKHIV